MRYDVLHASSLLTSEHHRQGYSLNTHPLRKSSCEQLNAQGELRHLQGGLGGGGGGDGGGLGGGAASAGALVTVSAVASRRPMTYRLDNNAVESYVALDDPDDGVNASATTEALEKSLTFTANRTSSCEDD